MLTSNKPSEMVMPAWKNKRRVMHRYDQSAKVYDLQYYEEQEAKISAAIDGLTLNKDSVVLDAGCGSGLLFAHTSGKAKFTVGADISRGILKEARKKSKISQNVSLIQTDADNMPFCDQVFDIVFAITLLQNVPNPLDTLKEIKRVSKSNATIIVTGLRKAFTQKEFSKMLKQANLKVTVLKTDDQMREFVCVCLKACR